MLLLNFVFTKWFMISVFMVTIILFLLWTIYGKKNVFLGWIGPCFFVIIFGIPYTINELYNENSGYYTLWGASEVLSFYGDVLTFIGAMVLGIIVYKQTQRHHLENKQRTMVNNSRIFPSLLFEAEKFDISNELSVFVYGKLDNQIARDYTDKQTRYIAKMAPKENIQKDEMDSYVQININGYFKYNGQARCNKVSINKLLIYYGNTFENKQRQNQYKLHPVTKNINDFFDDNKTIPIRFEIVSNKFFDNKSIIESTTESIYISIDFEFYDISGTTYRSTLELEYGWNGKRYIFIQQNYNINHIDYNEKPQNKKR